MVYKVDFVFCFSDDYFDVYINLGHDLNLIRYHVNDCMCDGVSNSHVEYFRKIYKVDI